MINPLDIVTITCYDKTKTMMRHEAIAFYKDCILASDGQKRHRYENIYMGLIQGDDHVSDQDLDE